MQIPDTDLQKTKNASTSICICPLQVLIGTESDVCPLIREISLKFQSMAGELK